MWELLEESLRAVNFPYTLLLGLVLFYWLTVFLGLLDLDFLSIDVDVDADVDVDMDADIDAGHHGGFSFGKLLHFFNIGEAPFMIIMTFLSLYMWVGSILFNHFMQNSSGLLAAGFAIPLIIVSLFLTKFSSWPFAKVFKALNKEEDTNVIGKLCEVKVGASDKYLGQAEVNGEKYHQLINIKAVEGVELKKGEHALILEYVEDGNYYIVEHSNQ
ncbi:MAG: hypothetical protein ACPGJS_21170 [Flammeovirgaceae bacterium]